MSSFGVSNTLKYYEFPLDSYDSTRAYSSGISRLDWPIFLVGGKRPLQNIAGVKVVEVQIPFSWYTLNNSNNTFILQEEGVPNTSEILVTMTSTEVGTTPLVPLQGNFAANDYSGDYVSAGLRLLANSLTYASAAAGNNTVFNVSFDQNTLKFRIDNSVLSPLGGKPFTLKFGGVNDYGNTNPRLLFGFNAGSNRSTEWDAVVGNTLYAPSVAQTTGPNYVYLNSQKLGNLTNMYLPRGALNLSGGNSGPQMAKIPVNCDPGNVIFWQDPDPEKYFDLENLDSLTEIDFYLTLGNTSGETPLRLNGGNFSLKLALIENDLTKNSTHSSLPDNRVTKRVRFD
jgi:hypothetical protein